MCPAPWNKRGIARECLDDRVAWQDVGRRLSMPLIWLSGLAPAFGFINFALGRSPGWTDAVGGAILEALLVMRRSCSGTRVSSGCLSWANRVGDKCLPVFWPPILISRPFAKVACHASFGLAGACKCSVVPCLGMSGVGMPPPIGRTRLFGSRINVGVASGFSCSDVSVAANFVTYTGFGRVGTLG